MLWTSSPPHFPPFLRPLPRVSRSASAAHLSSDASLGPSGPGAPGGAEPRHLHAAQLAARDQQQAELQGLLGLRNRIDLMGRRGGGGGWVGGWEGGDGKGGRVGGRLGPPKLARAFLARERVVCGDPGTTWCDSCEQRRQRLPYGSPEIGN